MVLRSIPKTQIKKTLLVMLCSGFCSSVGAISLLNEYRAAETWGRGGAGMAGLWGMDALFQNPSLLGQISNKLGEISLINGGAAGTPRIPHLGTSQNAVTAIREYTSEDNYYSLYNATGIATRWVSFGFLTENQVLAFRDNKDEPTESYHGHFESRNGLSLGSALPLFQRRFLLGAAGKIISKTQLKIDQQTGDFEGEYMTQNLSSVLDDNLKHGLAYGLDVGATAVLDPKTETKISIVLRDLNTNYFQAHGKTGMPDRDPLLLNVGFSSIFGTKKTKFHIYGDFDDILDQTNARTDIIKKTHVGTTLSVLKFFHLSAGANQGYLTLSTGVNIYGIFKADVGMYAQELGNTYGSRKNERYFLRLFLGYARF